MSRTFLRTACVVIAVASTLVACGTSGPDPAADAASGAKCPSGRGPAMAQIEQQGARTFCMDSTEVTRGQYRTFVASGDKPTPLRDACKANPSFEPSAKCLALDPACQGGDCDLRPQVCMDYCDAEAFCSWSGKTLCGTEDGKELSKAQLADPWATVWQRACRGLTNPADNGTRYPYGNDHQPETCNTPQRAISGCKAGPNTCSPVAAGSLPQCRSRGA